MTRDQLAELRRLATEVQQWIEHNDFAAVPLLTIRALARLAIIAVNTIEAIEDSRRQL